MQQPISDPPKKWGHKTNCLPEAGETAEFGDMYRPVFLKQKPLGPLNSNLFEWLEAGGGLALS